MKIDWGKIFLAIFMGGLIIYTLYLKVILFIGSGNQFSFTQDIVILIIGLLVLVLSKDFNNIKIGNIMTIKKEVEKQEKDLKDTKDDINNLRNQLINIVTNTNLNKNTTIVGGSGTNIQVLKGDVVEVEEEEIEEVEEEETKVGGDEKAEKQMLEDKRARRRLLHRQFSKISKITMDYYFKRENFDELIFEENVTLANANPIANFRYNFDAYCRALNEEQFFEVVITRSGVGMENKIYYLLSNVFHYRIAQQVNAKMILLIPVFPDSVEEGHTNIIVNRFIPRLQRIFKLAIEKNLLEIVPIVLEEEIIVPLTTEED